MRELKKENDVDVKMVGNMVGLLTQMAIGVHYYSKWYVRLWFWIKSKIFNK